MPFVDVLARRWSGPLYYREVPLADKVLPSLYFRRVEFMELSAAIQDVERREVLPVDHNMLRLVNVDPVPPLDSADEEASGDVKPLSSSGSKRRASWSALANSSPASMPVSRRLRPRRGAALVGNVQAPPSSPANPIDLSDDASPTAPGPRPSVVLPVSSQQVSHASPTSSTAMTFPTPPPFPGGSSATSADHSRRAGMPGVFVPAWSLDVSSRLSVFANGVEFARHAFSPATVMEMSNISPLDLVNNLRHAAAQSAAHFAEAANRIEQSLGDAAEVARLHSIEADLNGRLAKVESEASVKDEHIARLESERRLLLQQVDELQRAKLGSEFMHQELSAKNAALTINISELQRDLAAAQSDVDWLVVEGTRAVVDRVLMSDELGVNLVKLKDACLAAGVKTGKELLRKELGLAGDEGEDDGGAVSQEEVVEGAMNGVVDADYATHFGFAGMGVDGLKEMAAALEVKD